MYLGWIYRHSSNADDLYLVGIDLLKSYDFNPLDAIWVCIHARQIKGPGAASPDRAIRQARFLTSLNCGDVVNTRTGLFIMGPYSRELCNARELRRCNSYGIRRVGDVRGSFNPDGVSMYLDLQSALNMLVRIGDAEQ